LSTFPLLILLLADLRALTKNEKTVAVSPLPKGTKTGIDTWKSRPGKLSFKRVFWWSYENYAAHPNALRQ
jgi:hypothetical protein